MELKILGSVSPYCKEDKNCVGYLVKTNSSNILLDCGNGISRYMNLPKDLNNLTIIISHLHKDHYGELLALGYASYVYHKLGYIDKKIKVYIPKCSDKNSEIIDYTYLMNFGKENYMEFYEYEEETKLSINELKISFRKNPHQIKTFSTKLEAAEGTIVYSSDTGFKNNTLAEFALNCDILLCEATFLREQNKTGDNHLFAYEAALIAKEAIVKKLVLTHFWPEIDKQEYVNEAREIFENTEAAIEQKVLKIGGKIYE